MPDSPEQAQADDITDRQVEVLVHRVLAAVIAFLLAAAVAVWLNSDDTEAVDQRIEGSSAAEAVPPRT